MLGFNTGDPVTVYYEQEGTTHRRDGFFLNADHTGLIIRKRRDRNEKLLFFPADRIVMVEKEGS
jgi:hypothetical protein